MKKLLFALLATAALSVVAPIQATAQSTTLAVTRASVPASNQFTIQAAEIKANGPVYAESGIVVDSNQGIKFKILSTGAVTSAAPFIKSGSGTPEGAVTGPVGSVWLRTDGSTSTTIYIKTSGTSNTGWTAK